MTKSTPRLFPLALLLITLTACGGGVGSKLVEGSSSGRLGSSFQSTAKFSFPYDVAVNGDDNLWVADTGNNEIRDITPAGAVITLDGVN
jgi:hypothetical protein